MGSLDQRSTRLGWISIDHEPPHQLSRASLEGADRTITGQTTISAISHCTALSSRPIDAIQLLRLNWSWILDGRLIEWIISAMKSFDGEILGCLRRQSFSADNHRTALISIWLRLRPKTSTRRRKIGGQNVHPAVNVAKETFLEGMGGGREGRRRMEEGVQWFPFRHPMLNNQEAPSSEILKSSSCVTADESTVFKRVWWIWWARQVIWSRRHLSGVESRFSTSVKTHGGWPMDRINKETTHLSFCFPPPSLFVPYPPLQESRTSDVIGPVAISWFNLNQ